MKSLLLVAAVLFAGFAISAPAAESDPDGPDALIEQVYAASDEENPFFSDGQEVLRDYFTDGLAELITKDRKASQGEVGVIDGDPRYDAQDTDIEQLRVAPAKIEDETATVSVSFKNFDEKKRIVYRLEKNEDGAWRIDDVEWSSDRSLRKALEDAYGE